MGPTVLGSNAASVRIANAFNGHAKIKSWARVTEKSVWVVDTTMNARDLSSLINAAARVPVFVTALSDDHGYFLGSGAGRRFQEWQRAPSPTRTS
jgi:hypothetical protein